MPDVTREEATEIFRRGFGRELLREAMRVSTAIYWGEPVAGSTPRIRNSGTVVFIDGGEGPFAVSAHHVIEGYRQDVARDPGLVCYVSGTAYNPLQHIIAEDPSRDLVTLSISEAQLRAFDRGVHRNPGAWPPAPPHQGKGVFFGGFRGLDREQIDDRLGFGFSGGVGTATTVAGDRITVQFQREHWVCTDIMPGPPPNAPWGGASGGPVFALVQDGVMSWRLAGIISEFSDSFEILIAYGLNHLLTDGRLRP